MMIFQMSGAPCFVAAVQGGSCSLFINTLTNTVVVFCCFCPPKNPFGHPCSLDS